MKSKYLVAIVAVGVVATATSVYASSASTKVKDGKLSKAVAFADKHSLVEGTIDDKDSGYYYDLDKLSSDDDSYSVGNKFGDRYIVMNDKVFNMKTGEMEDEDFSDMKYDALKGMKKTLKGVSRYSVTDVSDIHEQEIQLANRFGDTWYRVKVNRDGKEGNCFIYYNKDHGCLDISYKTNLNFYDTESGKTVNIKEFGADNDGYKANMTDSKLIAQDSNNLYFLVNVEIAKNEGSTSNLSYILKTNKTAKSGSTVKYPSSIAGCVVSDSRVKTSSFTKLSELMTGGKEFSANDGKLFAISTTGSDTTVSTIDLKKISVSFSDDESADKQSIMAGCIGDSDSVNTSKYSIDANGKVWSVYKGEVMYYNGTKFVNKFEVDKSVNELDVYDDNNALCWSEDGDTFISRTGSSDDLKDDSDSKDSESKDSSTEDTLSEKDKDKQDNLATVSDGTTEVKDKTVDYQGHWEFNNSQDPNWVSADGKKLVNQWVYSNSSWYYLNTENKATKGWYSIGDVWYYFDTTGKMETGWTKIGDYWYCFGENGSMATGWKESHGSWYYLSKSHDGTYGQEMTGWINDGGEWYLLGSDGLMRTGWVKENDSWYYFNYQGKMLKDCVVDGYYLGVDGSLQEISYRLNSDLNSVRNQENSSTTTTSTNSNSNGLNTTNNNNRVNNIVNNNSGSNNSNNNGNVQNNSDGSSTFGSTNANGTR